MTTHTREGNAPQTLEEEASETFVQRLQGEWREQDQAALEARLELDPAYADAYRRVEESWGMLDTYAELPEILARRTKSLVYTRRSNARRWLTNQSLAGRWRFAAVAAALAALIIAVWHFSPYGYGSDIYRTEIGEQRLLDLEDHSRVVLDAKTRLQVRYTQDARVVRMLEGQAQFSVAKDAARPFKVQVGDRTIVALGTVFTVEYVDRNVRVAMLEGRVAVYPPRVSGKASSDSVIARQDLSPSRFASGKAAASVELNAGEEFRVGRDGEATVIKEADLESATAWREGKVVFRMERLQDAVRRLNRYSRVRIELEGEALATREISGVFEAGDTQGFVSAVQRYFPMVTTEHLDADTVRLRMN